MNQVAVGYEAVRRHVADAADHAGRATDAIRIVAVTKHVGVPEVTEALDAGIIDLGENRVQEFIGKYGLFPHARWHFIGSLQTNKVKDIVGKTHLIHSVDRVKLLHHIERSAAAAGVVQAILLQVNVSGEDSKHGFLTRDVAEVLSEASQMGNVAVKGFMTMAPYQRPEDVRWVFRELRELRDSLRTEGPNGVELDELSMGMTNDYRVAVEEGATIVRIGRAIFGK